MAVKITIPGKNGIPSITIGDLVKQYKDSGDNGVIALGGKLNVRPAYQRAFVYDPDDRNRVMQSVYNRLPLNSMYWAINADGTYEIIDGQQRTISICQFITNDDGNGNPIAINFNGKNNQTFDGLSPDKQAEILKYELQVYVCDGSSDEKLEWFQTINIAGKPMLGQELRNANYTGSWLLDAKLYFSKKANNVGLHESDYDTNYNQALVKITTDDANRQQLLELALRWITNTYKIKDGEKNPKAYPTINDYMAVHKNSPNADELKSYWKSVFDWVRKTFITYHSDMKGLEWGLLYNEFGKNKYNTVEIEKELTRLFGIYTTEPEGLDKGEFYRAALLTDQKAHHDAIWKRIFGVNQMKEALRRQGNKCGGRCGRTFATITELEGHHKKAYGDGGETTIENCVMLCNDCHTDITAHQNHEK